MVGIMRNKGFSSSTDDVTVLDLFSLPYAKKRSTAVSRSIVLTSGTLVEVACPTFRAVKRNKWTYTFVIIKSQPKKGHFEQMVCLCSRLRWSKTWQITHVHSCFFYNCHTDWSQWSVRLKKGKIWLLGVECGAVANWLEAMLYQFSRPFAAALHTRLSRPAAVTTASKSNTAAFGPNLRHCRCRSRAAEAIPAAALEQLDCHSPNSIHLYAAGKRQSKIGCGSA